MENIDFSATRLDPIKYNALGAKKAAANTNLDAAIEKLRAAYVAHAHNVLNLAGAIVQIRAELIPSQQWTAFLKSGRLPFKERTAQMLISIHGAFGDLDPQTFADLPRTWSVLAILARLRRDDLLRHIGSGAITPSITGAQARALLGQHVTAKNLTARDWLNRIITDLYGHCDAWSKDECVDAAGTLADVSETLFEAAGQIPRASG